MAAKARQVWPRRIRRIVQAVAFVAFIAFVVRLPALALRYGHGGLMRLSPLAGLGASISAWQLIAAFWPALVLLAAALLLGRFFCGWLCPMGTTLDISDRIIALMLGRKPQRRRPPQQGEEAVPDFEHVRGRRLKYYLLAACLVSAFAGVSFFGLFDPLSIAVRSYVLTLHSYLALGLLALFGSLGWSGGSSAARGWLLVRTDPIFQLQAGTLVALLALLALGLVRRRFWCRYVCPLGAVYALAGKPALTKRSVGDACTECGRCADACPMSCISPDGRRTLNDECILCLDCQAVCPARAVSFFGPTPAEQKREVDLTRRGILAGVAAGVVAYPVLRVRPAWERAKGDPLIRPPLAGRDVDAFLSKCLRCGQCMRACPTQVIQPAGVEAGIESLWTPKLSPRPGYCEYNCDLCGRACPTGAIPRFSLPQKHAAAMGLAYLDQTRCIPWRGYRRREEAGFVADEHNCGVCEEVCPVPGKAIHFQRVGGEGQELRLPYVRQESCVGCGYCEAVCPVVGRSAIRVTGGFRELAAPVVAEAAAPVRTEAALPDQAGALRLAGKRETYQGADELFDYIDGGAEPYLRLNFVRVTAAEYTDGQNKVRAGLWEFKTSDDAFGAFAKDRQGDRVDLGDEGAMSGSSLWARCGPFMLSVIDLGRTPADEVRVLAAAVLAALNEPPAKRPAVCRRLPAEGLDSDSVVFLRDELALFNLRLADEYIPDGTFGIDQGAVAAYGAYDLRQDDKPAGLLLVEHASAQAAAEAVSRLAQVRADWGEEQAAVEPFLVFKAAEGNYCAIGSSGKLFAAAFFVPSAEAGMALVRKALE